MGNELLRKALAEADMEIDDLAQAVQVDVKTAQRWLTGRVPHRRHQARAARALGVTASEIWPDGEPAVAPSAGSEPVVAADHLRRDGPVDWRGLLATATTRIDLLDYTLAEVFADSGVIDDLIRKAQEGVPVRILIAAPYSVEVYEAELEQSLEPGWWADYDSSPPPGDTARRAIHSSVQILDELRDHPGIQIRQFIAHRYNTILRFDEQMLVLIHTWGVETADALQLHTWKQADDGDTFDRFANHFEAIWDHSLDFDQPFSEDDLDEWELTLEGSTELSDRAYKLELYRVRADYNDTLIEARREYEAALDDLKRRSEEGSGNAGPPA